MENKTRFAINDRRRKKLREKILEKYTYIIDFCKDIGEPVERISRVLSGITHGDDDLWAKFQDRLEIPDSEIESYRTIEKNKPKYIRKKLKLKILGEFGKIQDFCSFTGIDVHIISLICNGKKYGALETWFRIQKALHIPDEEMWDYVKLEEVKSRNGKLQSADNN